MSQKLSNLSLVCILIAISIFSVFLSGCTVSARGKQRPLISHGPIRGEVELVSERRTDEHDVGQANRKSETTVFEERLRLRNKGDLYHPNLFYV